MISSIYLEPDDLEEHQRRMEAKYIRAQQTETRCEEYRTEDAELIVVGYGIVSRVLRSAVDEARKQGIKVGLFRPITLWPFPSKELAALAAAAGGESSGGRIEQRADGRRCAPP
jgi:pyruvate/2-oxoacid:ferredoxin oxidoreductase alpha subunit